MNGKKTYIASLGAILAAVGAVLQGAMEWPQAVQIVITAILAVTIRHGVSTEARRNE